MSNQLLFILKLNIVTLENNPKISKKDRMLMQKNPKNHDFKPNLI